jgi:hypothetical protein
VSLVLAGSLLFSAFWFLRGLIEQGNPIFPIAVNVWGKELLPGFEISAITWDDYWRRFVDSPFEWLVYPWFDNDSFTQEYGVGVGLGALFAVIVPTGLLFLVASTIRSRRWPFSPLYGALALGWLVLLVVWFLALREVPRFAMPLIATAILLSIPMTDFLLEAQPRALRLLVLTSVSVTAAIAVLTPVHDLLGRVRSSAGARADVYQYPQMIDKLPAGTTIWAPSAVNRFALAGEQLANRLFFEKWESVGDPVGLVRERRVDYIAYTIAPELDNAHLDDSVARLGARLVFADRVGPSLVWRIWDVRGIKTATTTALPKEEMQVNSSTSQGSVKRSDRPVE